MNEYSPSHLVERLPQQYFAKLRAQADKILKENPDAIDLAVGTPDLPPPERLIENFKKASDNKKYDKYGPYRGESFLKEAVADYYQRTYDVKIDPQKEIAVFHGSKEAIMKVFLATVNKNETVLLPDPTYPDYLSGAAMVEADIVWLPLKKENRFLPDYSKITQQEAENARLMFINYPNNPTAAVATPEFYEKTVAFAKEKDIIVAQDLAYGPLVYDNLEPISFLQTAGAKDIGVELFSLSKIFNISGWRIGFAVGNPSVIEYLNTLQDHTTVGMYGAMQEATAKALREESIYIEHLQKAYEERRNAFVEEFEKEDLYIQESKGSIFLWLEAPQGMSSEEFFEVLQKEAGVIVAPGSGFGTSGEGFVRIGLVKPMEEIKEGARRIASVMKKYPSA